MTEDEEMYWVPIRYMNKTVGYAKVAGGISIEVHAEDGIFFPVGVDYQPKLIGYEIVEVSAVPKANGPHSGALPGVYDGPKGTEGVDGALR